MKFLTLSKHVIIYSIALLLFYFVFTLFKIYDLFLYLFYLFFPLIIALFLHFLLDPIIEYFVNDRIKRRVVVISVYLFIILFFIVCVSLLVPFFIEQCELFYNDFKNGYLSFHPIVETLFSFLKQYNVIENIMGIINGWTKGVFFWISNILIGIGISFYLSYDNMHLIEKLIFYLPFRKQGMYMQALKKIKLVTYQFIKSVLLDFLFFFVISSILFFFIDKSICLWIGIFLALTNLIPYVGPIIGGVPVVIYEYMLNPQSGYIALIVIVILQYVESAYIQPILFSKQLKLHPIALFISLSLFGDLFGIVGMILSPLFLIYSIIILKLLKELDIYHKVKSLMDC
jgi:predicted PurR-regulated permease PerM